MKSLQQRGGLDIKREPPLCLLYHSAPPDNVPKNPLPVDYLTLARFVLWR